eukprot:NODE_864_length_3433_cov_0.732454.p4 type:complete len:112 gc:universal NODE_864_length_3433_cov_0.732454:688-1023(+)
MNKLQIEVGVSDGTKYTTHAMRRSGCQYMVFFAPNTLTLDAAANFGGWGEGLSGKRVYLINNSLDSDLAITDGLRSTPRQNGTQIFSKYDTNSNCNELKCMLEEFKNELVN